MIDKVTILSARKKERKKKEKHLREAAIEQRMFSGGPDGHLSAPQCHNTPPPIPNGTSY